MRSRLVAFVLFGALAVAACGASAASETGSAAGQASAGLEGEFPTLDGSSINLAEFEGQDVVLWFWAPW